MKKIKIIGLHILRILEFLAPYLKKMVVALVIASIFILKVMAATFLYAMSLYGEAISGDDEDINTFDYDDGDTRFKTSPTQTLEKYNMDFD